MPAITIQRRKMRNETVRVSKQNTFEPLKNKEQSQHVQRNTAQATEATFNIL